MKIESNNVKNINVFFATPNDLSKERETFREVLEKLNNDGFGEGANVYFKPLLWEDVPSAVGCRPQALMNQLINTADVFFLSFHRRWGQAAPDSEYSSYTEEEFHYAYNLFQEKGSPRIFILFKNVDMESELNPDDQLKKVQRFKKELEDSKEVLYRNFYDSHDFASELNLHLKKYVKGELQDINVKGGIILPIEYREEVEVAKKRAREEIEKAKKAHNDTLREKKEHEATLLEMATDAANLSNEGNIEFARKKFLNLYQKADSMEILFLSAIFFLRSGDLKTYEKILDKMSSLKSDNVVSPENAFILHGYGELYFARRNFNDALKMYKKSLGVNETLGNKRMLANDYNSIGHIYSVIGKNQIAEEIYKKSIELNMEINNKYGLAIDYGSLGTAFRLQGFYDSAEEYYNKSIKMFENIEDTREQATQYGNLALLFQEKGDNEKAEEMARKSLNIHENYGSKEGVARQLQNLGIIYCKKQQYTEAEMLFKKSLNLYDEIGSKNGQAGILGELGNIFSFRGEKEKAEEMYRKSLDMNLTMGRKDAVAIQYTNLGTLYKNSEKISEAIELYEKAVKIFKEIDHPFEKKVSLLLSKIDNNIK